MTSPSEPSLFVARPGETPEEIEEVDDDDIRVAVTDTGIALSAVCGSARMSWPVLYCEQTWSQNTPWLPGPSAASAPDIAVGISV